MEPIINPEKEAQAAVEQILPDKKKPGRKALQIFAVVVLLALIAGGVYALQNSRVAQLENQVTELKKTDVAETKKAADPYANWTTYTTNYEKLSFKYPDSLTLAYKSTPGTLQQITPGTETITLTSKSGLRLKIWNGVDGIGGECPDCKIARNDSISLFGSTSYLNYVSGKDNLVSSIQVATDKSFYVSADYKSKNVTIDQTKGPTVNLYGIGYVTGENTYVSKPLAAFTSDPALADIKLVLESFKY